MVGFPLKKIKIFAGIDWVKEIKAKLIENTVG
jgi:hypothetical protein